MLKKSSLIPWLVFSSLVACGKPEPAPVTPHTSAPSPAAETPAAPTATSPTVAPAPAPAITPPAATTEKLVRADEDKGKKIYDATCMACHAAGVAGAPKFGDKAAWGPRIAQGNELLYTHALKGFQGKAGMMPPKGGNMSLKDEDVKAAVDYMVSKGK